MAQSYNITTNSASTTQIRFLAPKDYDSTDIYMVNGSLRQLKQVDGNPIVHGWVTGAPLVFNLGEDGISMYMDINDVGVSKPVAVSSLEVGSILKLKKSDGSEVEYLVVHQGLPDATLYDTSCDGTWVLRKDILEERVWDSTDNDYGNSDIHTYLNTDFVNTFDVETKNAIKQVKIPYQNGTGGSVASGINGLSTNVFLLGGYEVGFSISDIKYFPIDGVKLDYFDAGDDTAANNKRVANFDGFATRWWLRSPDTGDANFVWHIRTDGFWNYWGAQQLLWCSSCFNSLFCFSL